MEIDSVNMTLDLPQVEKKQNSSTVSIYTDEVISHNEVVDSACWAVNSNSNSSSSSASAISSRAATTNFGLVERGKLQLSRNMTEEAKEKLNWWVQNLYPTKGKTLVSTSPQPVIASDASLRGWGVFCEREKTRGPWTALKKKDHIVVLELKVAK